MKPLESGSSSKASSTASAPTTPPGIPAPYGRACANCVKAKCKCFYRGSGRELTSCERCHRLGKDCVPSETIRRRTSRRQTTSRTAQLEEKLDDLVSLLKTQQQPPPGVGSAATLDPTTRVASLPNKDLAHSQAQQAQILAGVISPVSVTTTSSAPVPNNHQPSLMPSPPKKARKFSSDPSRERTASSNIIIPTSSVQLDQEAEECLQTFSKGFLHSFPFFHVTENMTASQLQLKYPVFMLAIKSVTCKLFPQLKHYSKQLQQTLAQKIVLDYEHSIDLLLALLTCIGWFHFHESRRPFLTTITRLAISQAIELGLHRPFGETNGINAFRQQNDVQKNKPARTNEQRRAALGCYFVTSAMFTVMQRAEGLPWTPYLEEMMSDLTKESDWHGDEVLVFHVKLQQVNEQVYKARFQHGIQLNDSVLLNEPHKGLPSYYINLLLNTVRTARSCLSESAANDVGLDFLQKFVEAIIAESALDHKEPPFTKPTQFTKPTSVRQLENLHALLEAVERLFNSFYEAPPIRFYYMAYPVIMSLPHAMWMLLKLCTTYADSVWDPNEARRRIDLLQWIDLMREKLLAIPVVAGLVPTLDPTDPIDPDNPPETDVFSKCGPMMDAVRVRWGAELQKYTIPPQTLPNSHDGTSSTTLNGCTIPATQQGPIATTMNMDPGFAAQNQPSDLIPIYLPQYDVSSWLSFPSIEQSWYPMDMAYN